jgi:RNA polymerase sigma-70 factor (ECF subfamily)
MPAFDASGKRGDVERDWSAQTDEPAIQGELRSLLNRAVSDLPPDYRTAFVLHDVEGMSNPEIAQALKISLPAVKSRVHRSRLFLRQRLAEYMANAGPTAPGSSG